MRESEKKPIPVDLLMRHRSGAFSMERIFRGLMEAMPEDIQPAWKQVPEERCGLRAMLTNLIWCRTHCNTIVHITGDIHYCVLGLRGRRMVLTIHDLVSLNRAAGWRKWLLRKLWYDWPMRRCSAITCISENTRNELLALHTVPPEKIVVIPDPVGAEFISSPKTFQTANPRILHFNMKANKNLLKSIAALKGFPCHLRIVGRLTEPQTALLNECRVEYSNVFNLSDQEIVEEFRQCDLLCFPSTYEGFGMPVVEAQATGRAVVTSNRPPLTTTAGRGACFVDPESSESIRQGIEKVCGDQAYREQLIQAGLENVRNFSLPEIARRYAEIYRRLA